MTKGEERPRKNPENPSDEKEPSLSNEELDGVVGGAEASRKVSEEDTSKKVS